MDEFDTLQPATAGSSAGQTTSLFLSLYVLVLAFFIVLVTISSPEKVKSRAVMDSLTSTFASLMTPSTELTTFSSKEGDFLAAQAFQEQVGNVFSTTIKVAKVEIVQPGRLMRVVMPSDSLFQPGTTEIRDAQVPLLDRIVASLSVTTPGQHYDLEFVIGVPYGPNKSLPAGETLETARAGVFARAMLARGVPPDSIAVALRPGDAGEVVMRFYVRPQDETRLKFDQAPAGRAGRGGGP